MDGIKIPDHLIVRFRIRDNETRKIIASSRNLREVLELSGVTRGSAANNSAAKKYTSWNFGEIKNSDESTETGWSVKLYKALYDEGDGVTLRLFKTEETAKKEHAKGVARLLALEMSKFAKRSFSSKSLSFQGALYFKSINYDTGKLSDDIFMKAVRIAAVDSEPRILTAEAFSERVKTKRAAVNDAYAGLAKLVSLIFEEAGRASSLADSADLPDDIALDINTQLAWLVYRGLVATVPYEKLKLYPRYFKALEKRIERAKVDKTRDRSKMARFEPYWTQYHRLITDKNARISDRRALSEYRWLLEEYRISLFAQEIKTIDRVSPDVLSRLWLTVTVS
jgi:ATP-dependent helicase HrpA